MTTSCLVTTGRRLLYYTGWIRGVTVPFYLAAGVATSEGGGPFERSRLPRFSTARRRPVPDCVAVCAQRRVALANVVRVGH